jgi:hypothetical protein
MNARREITLFDSRQNRARVRKIFYVLLLILLIVDYFIPKHGHYPWEEAYAFFAVYGFIACVSLIFLAKGLRWLVKRSEDYYD